MATRQEKILVCIDPATQLGLEIGALSKPIVTPGMGDIRYVDHATTEELRQKYAADPNVETEQIVDVSYVWGEKSLHELVEGVTFDYVIASHVIEHVPDLVGWLKEIHAVLKPGGILSLAIPDKRYCFDYLRQLSSLPEVVEASLQKNRKPNVRQIFDYFWSISQWGDQFTWTAQDQIKAENLMRNHAVTEAWDIAQCAFVDQSYCDVHCWVFTPMSFFELLKLLSPLDLVDFRVSKFYQSVGCEFYVTLEALDLTKSQQERQQIQLTSLAEIDLEETQPVELLLAESAKVDQIHLLTDELAQERMSSELLQAQLEEFRRARQRLKAKVKHLHSNLENREHEIVAMQSSKFWKLREVWIRVRKAIRIRGG
jgi:predicted SAM-dependent methyltransferase